MTVKNSDKYLIIGDVHGRYNEMMALFEAAPKDRQIIFIGDYIDRGPDSSRVVSFVKKQIELGAIALRGNHEDMILKAYGSDEINETYAGQHFMNGGVSTIASFLGNENSYNYKLFHQYVQDNLLDFIKGLKITFHTEDFLCVHAGVYPRLPLEEQRRDDIIWIRDAFLSAPAEDFYGYPLIIHGHSHEEVLKHEHRINTYQHGFVTGLLMPEREILQIKNQ